jgi:hypothetical protein
MGEGPFSVVSPSGAQRLGSEGSKLLEKLGVGLPPY